MASFTISPQKGGKVAKPKLSAQARALAIRRIIRRTVRSAAETPSTATREATPGPSNQPCLSPAPTSALNLPDVNEMSLLEMARDNLRNNRDYRKWLAALERLAALHSPPAQAPLPPLSPAHSPVVLPPCDKIPLLQVQNFPAPPLVNRLVPPQASHWDCLTTVHTSPNH